MAVHSLLLGKYAHIRSAIDSLIKHNSPVRPGVKMTFRLTSKQGAALITNHATYREDIEREHNFETYIKKYYDSWVDFAQEQGHGEDIKPVLVTGVDLTKQFAAISYSDNQTTMECDFSMGTPDVDSVSLSVWGSWHTRGSVHTTCGPDELVSTRGAQRTAESSISDSVVPGEYDQCVFVRYYTIRKRFFIPVLLKAGAGPHQLPKGNTRSDSTGVVIVENPDSDDDLAEVGRLEKRSGVIHSVPPVSAQ